MFEVRGSAERFDFVVGKLRAQHLRKPFTEFFARKLACGPLPRADELQAIRFLPSEALHFYHQVVRRLFRDRQCAARERSLPAPKVQERATPLRVDFVLEIREGCQPHAIFANFNGTTGGERLKRLLKFGRINHARIIDELLEKSVIFLDAYCN